jgi:hypothetical protein
MTAVTKVWPFAGTIQSPLSDSNRRPLPYHGRVRVLRAFTDAFEWARNPCKFPQCGVYGRGAPFALVLDLVDAEWTRCTPLISHRPRTSITRSITASARLSSVTDPRPATSGPAIDSFDSIALTSPTGPANAMYPRKRARLPRHWPRRPSASHSGSLLGVRHRRLDRTEVALSGAALRLQARPGLRRAGLPGT